MIPNKIIITSTAPLLFNILCSALRIDYPRNEVAMRHEQRFNAIKRPSHPSNHFKHQVEVIEAFKQPGFGQAGPDKALMGNLPLDRYPKDFGNSFNNNGRKFPFIAPQTQTINSNFVRNSDKTSHPTMEKSVGFKSSGDHLKTGHLAMGRPEQAQRLLRPKSPFPSGADFGRQNRQLIDEGNHQSPENFKSGQQSYKDVFSKAFEGSRSMNPSSGNNPISNGSPKVLDMVEDYPSSPDVYNPNDFSNDDFKGAPNTQYDGPDVNYSPEFKQQKYESNYASGYYRDAHSYYKFF